MYVVFGFFLVLSIGNQRMDVNAGNTCYMGPHGDFFFGKGLSLETDQTHGIQTVHQ